MAESVQPASVHPGSFCSPPGATGQTVNGTGMVCAPHPEKGGRARWRSDGTTPARAPRRRAARRSTATAAVGTLPIVDAGINPHAVPAPAAAGEQPAPPVTPPAEPEQATTMPPRSAQPLEPPNGGWGIDQGLMHFDGALGRLWNGLDDDRHLTVDGRPLGNVIKDLGEGISLDKHSSQHALDDLRRIRRQLPDGSRPAQLVDAAINRLDAPDRPLPDLPANTPPQLRTLVEELNAIPLVRRGRDVGGGRDAFHETDMVADMAHRWSAGQLRPFTFESELRNLTGHRHESMEGWSEIRSAVAKASRDINQWGRRPR